MMHLQHDRGLGHAAARWLVKRRPQPASFLSRISLCRIGMALALLLPAGAAAQDPAPPKDTIKDGYAIHQTADLGGRVVGTSGSGAMYDTLVNLQSGPRILGQTLDMHAVAGTPHP